MRRLGRRGAIWLGCSNSGNLDKAANGAAVVPIGTVGRVDKSSGNEAEEISAAGSGRGSR